jgi:c-di-GMP-binding flagellar brake protein YcgR
MKDHRKSVRVDANLFISYDILNRDGDVVQAGMALSEDISQKGVKIKDRSTLPVDTSIIIHLAVGDEVVDLSGKVRHVQKVTGNNYQIGVEFEHIDREMLEKMVKYYPEILNKEK